MPKTNSTPEFQAPAMKISELWIYPIKSCAGFQVSEAELSVNGLRNDRRWQFVEAESRVFITQRQLPKMSLIEPKLLNDVLHLKFGSESAIDLRVLPQGSKAPLEVTTWSDKIQAYDSGDPVATLASEFLGRSVRLVEIADPSPRRVNPKYTTLKSSEAEVSFGFADSTPLLVITEASLRGFSTPVDRRRFRANIIVAGDIPTYDENHWREMKIGDADIRFGRYCTRCPIIEVEPDAGQRVIGLLKTLVELNPIDRKPVFGINCYFDPREKAKIILNVGDSVAVVART